jgi:hypothetical protein
LVEQLEKKEKKRRERRMRSGAKVSREPRKREERRTYSDVALALLDVGVELLALSQGGLVLFLDVLEHLVDFLCGALQFVMSVVVSVGIEETKGE